jgi:hypothetical protein
MSRILIVTYRPAPGHFEEVIALLRAQYQRIRALGVDTTRPPILVRSAAGELTYVASFAHADEVDRCWEDPEFQDLDGRLAEVAEMIPLRALHEASGSYADLEEVGPDRKASPLARDDSDEAIELLS